jgi:hypothetical protein
MCPSSPYEQAAAILQKLIDGLRSTHPSQKPLSLQGLFIAVIVRATDESASNTWRHSNCGEYCWRGIRGLSGNRLGFPKSP